MKKKKAPSFVLFESKEAAKIFLINQFEIFKALPSIAERKKFLLEFKISPEFRVATTILEPSKVIKVQKKTRVDNVLNFCAEYGPFQDTLTRDHTTDLLYTKEFYKVNHRKGHP